MPDEIKTGYVVTYNSFNKIGSISETGAYRQDFTYAADEHRRVSKLYNSSGVLKKETIYVPGGYEVEKRGTNTRRLHYIPVGDCWALYTKNSAGADSLYFLLTDHLGSVHVITNASGAVQKEMSFDPWGRRRNPVDWTYNSVPAVSITSRGFTMHEHMDQFKLINMNGRVYDPVLGQFLSPDPFVSNPASTASYNRYAYCNYNPLKYVDPSGYQKTTKGMEPIIIVNFWGLREHSPFGRYPGGRGTYWNESPYTYNEYSDTYSNAEGQTVSYWEVYHNYIIPNSVNVTNILLPILGWDYYTKNTNEYNNEQIGDIMDKNGNIIGESITNFLGINSLTLEILHWYSPKERKGYNSSGGMEFKLSYSNGLDVCNYNWAQLFSKDNSGTWIIDNTYNGKSTGSAFYWSADELIKYNDGYQVTFYDNPVSPSLNTDFRFVLGLFNNTTPVFYIYWGYSTNNGITTPHYPSLID